MATSLFATGMGRPELSSARARNITESRPAPERTPVRTPVAQPRATPASLHHVVPARAENTLPPEQYLSVELALLSFQERVLELAEDPATPLAERLRFLSICSANLDEFFATRVGPLKQAVLAGLTGRSLDGMAPREQLEAIAARVPPLLARQAVCARECLEAARAHGVVLKSWDELMPPERDALTAYFTAELLPVLTPRAVTMSPGHPFPLIPQLVLSFGVVVTDVRTGPIHFAALPLKHRLDRFLKIPGSEALITIEAVVRANIQAFYPDRPVEGAWLFRITRAADLEVEDEDAGDLLQAIEEEVMVP